MKRKFSTLLILLGIVLILGAGALLLYNQRESDEASAHAAEVLPEISAYLGSVESSAELPPAVIATDPSVPLPDMPVHEIGGQRYVGVLTIPSIGYEMPVLSECSLALLRLGACRFHGSTYAGNLVLCAHNYHRLYSQLAELHAGDAVWFTDMDGLTWTYEVADLEILQPDMVEEMNDSGYALTFFTCTYGGQSRLALRCVRP